MKMLLMIVLLTIGCIDNPVGDAYQPYKCPTLDMSLNKDTSKITRITLPLDKYNEVGIGIPWEYKNGFLTFLTLDCRFGSKDLYFATLIPVKEFGWNRIRLSVTSSYEFSSISNTAEGRVSVGSSVGEDGVSISNISALNEIGVVYNVDQADEVYVKLQVLSRCDVPMGNFSRWRIHNILVEEL